MNRAIVFSAIAAAAAFASVPALLIQPASAQVDVYIATPPPYPPAPPRGGAWGDRDRDGIPNAVDRYDNRRAGNRGDQDRDGIPNRYDRDRDGDGVPNRWDRNPSNPYRR